MKAEKEPVLAAVIQIRELPIVEKFQELSTSTRSLKISTHIQPTEMAENESLLEDCIDRDIKRVNEIVGDSDSDEFEVDSTQTGIQQVSKFYYC